MSSTEAQLEQSPILSDGRVLESVDEFRGAFGNMSRTKFYEEVKAGRIKTVTLGRRRLVPVTQRREYLEILSQPA